MIDFCGMLGNRNSQTAFKAVLYQTMAQLPKDPVMLLSFTNTQLRDFYPNLSEFCKAFMVDETEIVQTLKGIDYEYDTTRNQFI